MCKFGYLPQRRALSVIALVEFLAGYLPHQQALVFGFQPLLFAQVYLGMKGDLF